MKRFRVLGAVVVVLALVLGVSTASAAPLYQTSDVSSNAYLISGGTFQSGYPADHAFDDNTDNLVSMGDSTTWFGQDFGEGAGYNIGIVRVLRSSSGGSYGFYARFQYSDDGATWYDTNLTAIAQPIDPAWVEYAVDDFGSHRYWRFANTTTTYSQVTEIELLAREDETPTATPVATTESVQVYIDYPTPVPQYFDPTANAGDGPEPWMVRFYVGVFVVFAFTYVVFRLVDTHQFYLLFMALCMAAAWVTKSVNGAAYVYLFMLIMALVLKLWGGLQRLVGVGK